MKEIVLLIDGKTTEPFPLEEIETRFAAGEFPAETPCASPGDETWSTLGETFPQKKKNAVHVAKKTREEENEMKVATSEKLDPDVRKKLLLYNLADAISVDKFTPVQADAAIKMHEAELRKDRRLKIFAGTGGFVVAFALASLIFNFVEIGTAPGGRGLKIFEKVFETPPNPENEKYLKRVMTDVRKLNELRNEVAAVKFTAPRGQGDPRQIFLANVVIKNPDVSTVTGTVDYSALAGLNFPQGVVPEVVQFKRMDGNVAELMNRQRELFNILCTPLWTNKELREAIVRDLAPPVFPGDATIPESVEIWRYITNLRVDQDAEIQLQNLSRRVEEIAQSKDLQQRLQSRMSKKFKDRAKKNSAPKNSTDAKTAQRVADRQASSQAALQWARGKMPKFFEKLSDYLAEKEIYFSVEERKRAWTEFSQNELPKIQEFVAANEIARVPELDGHAFVLPGRNTRHIVVDLKFPNGAGDVYFIPAEADAPDASGTVALPDLKVNRKILTPEDVLLDEHYVVTQKTKTGGKPLYASGKMCGENVYVVRTTPEWFFIEVERVFDDGDAPAKKPSVVLRVPAEFFETVNVGDAVPMEKLLTFERFSRPAESVAAGRLSPIPAEEFDAVKASQARAGIVFPPPPEAPAAPVVKKSETPAPPENSAETPSENSAEKSSDAPSENAPEAAPDAPAETPEATPETE